MGSTRKKPKKKIVAANKKITTTDKNKSVKSGSNNIKMVSFNAKAEKEKTANIKKQKPNKQNSNNIIIDTNKNKIRNTLNATTITIGANGIKKEQNSKPDFVKKQNSGIKKTSVKKRNIQKNKNNANTENKDKLKKIYNLKLLKSNRKFFNKKRVIFLTVFILTALIIFLNAFTPTGMFEYISNGFASFKKGSFPAATNGSLNLNIKSSGKNLVCLTDTSLEMFNKNGGKYTDISHGFSNPAASISNARSIVYNVNDKKFLIANMSRVLYNGSNKTNIINATIARNGYYSITSKTTGYESVTEVFKKSNTSCYKWYSSSSAVTETALSNNGKRLAAATVKISGGEALTEIYSLKYSSATPVFKSEVKGSVINLKTLSNSCFCAVFGEKIVYYNWDGGELFNLTGSNGKLAFFKNNSEYNGENLAIFHNGLASDSYKIYYMRNNQKKYEIDYNEAILDADIYKGNIYILTNRNVKVINKNGETIKKYSFDENAENINISKGIIYLSNDISIFRIK